MKHVYAIENVRKSFGARVLSLRKALATEEIKQASIAEAAGMDQQSWSRIERGVANPTLTTITMIAGALSVPVADLFTDMATKPIPPDTVNTTVNLTLIERAKLGSYAKRYGLSVGEVIRRAVAYASNRDLELELESIATTPAPATPALATKHATEELDDIELRLDAMAEKLDTILAGPKEAKADVIAILRQWRAQRGKINSPVEQVPHVAGETDGKSDATAQAKAKEARLKGLRSKASSDAGKRHHTGS